MSTFMHETCQRLNTRSLHCVLSFSQAGYIQCMYIQHFFSRAGGEKVKYTECADSTSSSCLTPPGRASPRSTKKTTAYAAYFSDYGCAYLAVQQDAMGKRAMLRSRQLDCHSAGLPAFTPQHSNTIMWPTSSVSAPHTQLGVAGSPPQAPQLYQPPPHPPPRSSPLRRARPRAAARRRRPHAETLAPPLHPPRRPTRSLVAPLPPSPTAARAGRCRPTPAAGPCHLPGSTCSGSQGKLGGLLWSIRMPALHMLVRPAKRGASQHRSWGKSAARHKQITPGHHCSVHCVPCRQPADMRHECRNIQIAGPHTLLHARRWPPRSAPSSAMRPLAAAPSEPSAGCAACAPPMACPFAMLPAGPPSGRPPGLHLTPAKVARGCRKHSSALVAPL